MPASGLRRNAATKVAWAAVLGAAATGCQDAVAPDNAPLNIRSVAVAADSGSIFRSLIINLSDPVGVQVDYWAAGAPHLRVVAAGMAGDHSVFLPGLRAGHTYDYEVRPFLRGFPRDPVYRGRLATDPLPDDLAAVQFAVAGTPAHRYTMVELRGDPFSGYVILDRDGQVVWFRRGIAESFARRANGDLVLLEAASALTEVRPDLTVVARLPAVDTMSMHHDVIATPHNTLLFLTHDLLVENGISWIGDAVWEWSPETGAVARRWRAQDFLSPDTDLGPKSVGGDWLHANSLSLGPRGNLLVSLPALNQIVSIAPGYHALEWRLGGPNATIVPDAASEFWFEHTAQEIAPNRILMFDNGRDRPAGKYSRGLELELDPSAGAARVVWSFVPAPAIYAPIIGSTRRLSGGVTVVDFGTPAGVLGSSGPIATYDVSLDGRVTWSLHVTGNALLNYRATPLDAIAGEQMVLHGERPAVSGKRLTPEILPTGVPFPLSASR
jgi:Arylsulfotransferase (ASST)